MRACACRCACVWCRRLPALTPSQTALPHVHPAPCAASPSPRSSYLRVVKLTLLGSVISNLLLVMGCSFVAGGALYKQQSFNKEGIAVNSGLLILAGEVAWGDGWWWWGRAGQGEGVL